MAERKRTYELLQEEWGERIRVCRGDRTQTWLAQQIGVDQTTISRIERGVYRLTPELMVALAAALEAPIGVLFSFPRGLMSRETYEREAAQARAATVGAAS